MESIDALADAVNLFEGGLVLVSHDMRLISQVARELWICDHNTITRYRGDIMNFKMDMRAQMGLDSDTVKLKGDASVKATDKPKKAKVKKEEPKLEVIKPMVKIEEAPPKPEPPKPEPPKPEPAPLADDATVTTVSSAVTSNSGESASTAPKRYIPPHLRKKMAQG
jgi:ATP-binding cassette subfamily F protein 2